MTPVIPFPAPSRVPVKVNGEKPGKDEVIDTLLLLREPLTGPENIVEPTVHLFVPAMLAFDSVMVYSTGTELPLITVEPAQVPVKGFTTTGGGTGATCTDAVPITPATLAVIVAGPVLTPVTSPAGETLATAGLLDAQVVVRPGRTFPAASRAVAAICNT